MAVVSDKCTSASLSRRISAMDVWMVLAAIASALLLIFAAADSQAQTFTVLHNFTGGADGYDPYAGVTLDSAGNLYGTTLYGGVTGGSCGVLGCGVVFKLAHRGSGWTLTPIYTFTGGSDGAFPAARVLFGPDGTLYGTTVAGGSGDGTNGGGVVFRLQPPAHIPPRVSSPWTESIVHPFGPYSQDGNAPGYGDLLFDQVGDIYGTTYIGGYECEDTVYCGIVFKLTRNANGWTEDILDEFMSDFVALPEAGVVFDQAGNLYGTATDGPGSAGAVYQLTPSGTLWIQHDVHVFGGTGDGSSAVGGLIGDPAGNFYGTTMAGGINGAGTVYEITPTGGGWTESVIYNFVGPVESGSAAALTRDSAGNLYGTTCGGGTNHNGSVFKLTPSGGGWTETDLYAFTGGNDGSCPWGSVTRDAAGNLYGTTAYGGTHGDGVVWEITP